MSGVDVNLPGMGSYLDLDGHQIYYDEAGAGEPVFLLHGGMTGADTWQAQVAGLAGSYHVFVPERRGHGHTADVPGPYTTENMTAETAAVIDALVGGPAHVIGWSDGAYVAACLALRRPDLVNRLVLIGQAYSTDGETATVRKFIYEPGIAEFFRDDYAATSPDGADHFDVVFDKVMHLWRNPLDLPLTDMARITAPTLVMQGDDDGVRIEYSAALASALPDAQLAIVPGTGHGAPLQKPDLVNRMILDFLAPNQPARFIALGSLHDSNT
jgi:pimeloyl-ACP methyl ester carboxylesterase